MQTTKMGVSLDLLPQLLRFNNHLLPIILSAVLFLILKTCFYGHSSSRTSKMKLPPGPKPLPVLGNMTQFIRAKQSLHVVLHDLAKAYGPICHLKVGQVSLVSVTSSEVAKEILKTQELTFAQRPKSPIFEAARFDQGGLGFAPYGEYWRKIRKVCVMELLSPRRVREFRSLREQRISDLMESVKCTTGLPFNISEMIFNCSNGIMLEASFGQKCSRLDKLSSAVTEELRLASQSSLADVFPSLWFLNHLNGVKAKMTHFRAVFEEILGGIIADQKIGAKSRIHSSSYEENLVDVLLRLQESTETASYLSDNTIKDIILDMVGGGVDTSPAVVEWALSEMMKNSDIMKKVQAELRDSSKGKAILEEADLEKNQYLKLIIKETLRLHPPAVFVGRVSREDCIIHGYDIPKESRVLINSWSLGRDPNCWENPEKFYPERFQSSSIDLAGTNFEFLPFGSGKRMCPGARFAVASIELMLANLIYYFDWKLANGLAPEELDMVEDSGLTVRRLNPLIVVATPHHSTG
ncbi:hypothetical protein MLD38_038524 [Melastoma candidum]|uniref:Uncharacterized protein n=1 Tax=Melastoma candidum TaxID=119954 RepID=A0ACB9KZS7_9MYRT|nr:hypothetical protein MLD38_038524 [Melastoma candidum]